MSVAIVGGGPALTKSVAELMPELAGRVGSLESREAEHAPPFARA